MSDESEQSSDAAYSRAIARYDLFGEKLRPYSQVRRDAADLMGLQYPWLSEEDADRLRKTNHYPAIKRDTAIVLWLCSIPDEEDLSQSDIAEKKWTPERACAYPIAATREAMTWLNSKSWGNIDDREFLTASGTMCAIRLDVELSSFKVQTDEPGEQKKSKTTTRTRGRKQPAASTKSRDTV